MSEAISEATVAGILDDYEKAFATFRADPSADGRVRLRSTLIEIAGRMEVEARNWDAQNGAALQSSAAEVRELADHVLSAPEYALKGEAAPPQDDLAKGVRRLTLAFAAYVISREIATILKR